jgi:hypothetical protein
MSLQQSMSQYIPQTVQHSDLGTFTYHVAGLENVHETFAEHFPHLHMNEGMILDLEVGNFVYVITGPQRFLIRVRLIHIEDVDIFTDDMEMFGMVETPHGNRIIQIFPVNIMFVEKHQQRISLYERKEPIPLHIVHHVIFPNH